MAEAKTAENEDIKFSVAELTSDDQQEADLAREKRNSPLPEQFRNDPAEAVGYPVPEDRKPAVMRADKESDHDYQITTYDNVNENARKHEANHGVGSVATLLGGRKLQELAEAGEGVNEFQAPPSDSARAAAEGQGAESRPVPVIKQDDGKQSKQSSAKK